MNSPPVFCKLLFYVNFKPSIKFIVIKERLLDIVILVYFYNRAVYSAVEVFYRKYYIIRSAIDSSLDILYTRRILVLKLSYLLKISSISSLLL